MFSVFPTARLRPSPFYESAVAEGMVAASIYNRMIMPTSYGHPEEEYWRIINGVSQWDVGVERQVQLRGKDAGKLAQILATRDLSKCQEGQGKYVAICNHKGTLINDPIILKRADDLFWLSIADSNILFWARAIAAERGLNVEITEPDVSPLAVQGPKAEDVVASIFGDWVRALKYFWFRETAINGIPVAVARSGWSKQGGFEIYLMDGSRGTELWNIVKEAGKAWDIGPGNPNVHERIESGLISYGGDTDDFTNPFEVRMGKYVDLTVPDDTVGIQALRAIKAQGVKRHQLGVALDNEAPAGASFVWFDILADGAKIGSMTNIIWSYRIKKNIGFGLLAVASKPGDRVTVLRDGKAEAATLAELPFL